MVLFRYLKHNGAMARLNLTYSPIHFVISHWNNDYIINMVLKCLICYPTSRKAPSGHSNKLYYILYGIILLNKQNVIQIYLWYCTSLAIKTLHTFSFFLNLCGYLSIIDHWEKGLGILVKWPVLPDRFPAQSGNTGHMSGEDDADDREDKMADCDGEWEQHRVFVFNNDIYI